MTTANQRENSIQRGATRTRLWSMAPVFAVFAGLLSLAMLSCRDEEVRRLDPVQVGMPSSQAPFYEDGELALYEVKRAIEFPIRRWGDGNLAELRKTPVEPFGRAPWYTAGEVEIRVSWVISNLDPQGHSVRLLIDPWNEFGRYYPGLAATNAEEGEQMPNLSGMDLLVEVPGTADSLGRSSRVFGDFNGSDLEELAIDFATVMNLIDKVPPPEPGADAEDDLRVVYTNHAFNLQNRSYNSPLVAQYRPTAIPGLTGLEVGLRTTEPANVALEIVVELLDKGNGKVIQRDETDVRPIGEPRETITVGAAP